MSWEQVTLWLDNFSNNPIVIAVTGILTTLFSFLIILKNTSFGKRAIEKLTKLYELAHDRANETLEKVKEVETLAKEKIEQLEAFYEEKTKEIQRECEQRVACALSIVNFYEESLFALIEQIPNKKVQSLLGDLKDKYQDKKGEIAQIVEFTYQDYNEHIELIKQEVRQEYDEKINFLENQIAQLELFLNEVKGEPNDGEREETINSNPTEETLQEPCESV